VTALDKPLLAAGAALSLLAGAATAQFGLAPLEAALGRQALRVPAISMAQSGLAAGLDQMPAADFRGTTQVTSPADRKPADASRHISADADETPSRKPGPGPDGEAQDARSDREPASYAPAAEAPPIAPTWEYTTRSGDTAEWGPNETRPTERDPTPEGVSDPSIRP
jgi:hypothetical protein